MFPINPLHQIDFYKSGHVIQYPEGTTEVYSNFTPRSAHHAPVLPTYDNKVVWFGLQGFIKAFLIFTWDYGFFNEDKAVVVAAYKRRMDNALGVDAVPVDHIEALHDLGYLPIEICALPEGSRVNIKVPCFTIKNTIRAFGWLTNYLETVLSNELWKPATVATIAYEYRRLLESYAEKTGAPLDFVSWQGHDFSARGMSGCMDSAASGAGHLLSFFGTDSVSAIDYLETFYDANAENEVVGNSVPATEHSVMCMGGQDDEIGTFKRLITELYPAGIVSIVSDTWDFWQVITEFAKTLKPEIMARNGKVVFRPDSGDPVRILCGYLDSEIVIRRDDGTYIATSNDGTVHITEAERKGAVQCLWDIFGGTTTDKGFKVLDEHVGLIYGDSITLQRANEIMRRLEAKGFASNNVVLGIGSYTYQYLTRDTFGWAMKATSGVVNGQRRDIAKNPKTDGGTKKSACGLLRVEKVGEEFVLHDRQTEEQAASGELRTVFRDGVLLINDNLATIRGRLLAS